MIGIALILTIMWQRLVYYLLSRIQIIFAQLGFRVMLIAHPAILHNHHSISCINCSLFRILILSKFKWASFLSIKLLQTSFLTSVNLKRSFTIRISRTLMKQIFKRLTKTPKMLQIWIIFLQKLSCLRHFFLCRLINTRRITILGFVI